MSWKALFERNFERPWALLEASPWSENQRGANLFATGFKRSNA